MKDPRNVMEAIDLLMAAKRRKGLPIWLKPLDYALACAYLSGVSYIIYKLVTWL